jgi:aminopeptidase N
MEALANYSALLYLEKSRGGDYRTDLLLEHYRTELLETNQAGDTVDSTGPIALGSRLQDSQEPRAWRAITYGKGSSILHMLRRRLGDTGFFALLAEVLKKHERSEISTEQFRVMAAKYLPPKSEDARLELFFEQWIYGTGIPTLKLSHTTRGKAPDVRLIGTLTQSDVSEDFSTLVPVEIQVARNRTVTHWVASGGAPVTFTVPLKQAPLKVTLDPKRDMLRR